MIFFFNSFVKKTIVINLISILNQLGWGLKFDLYNAGFEISFTGIDLDKFQLWNLPLPRPTYHPSFASGEMNQGNF